MAENLISELRESLSTGNKIAENEFDIVQKLSSLLNKDDERSEKNYQAHQLLLRALDKREYFVSTKQIIDDLVRKVGLYPYLNPEDLELKELLAYEIHRPENFDEEIVFHKVQAKVYFELLNDENVILSAPTSFGKSLIIDAVISSAKYANIVIVVPTIALIDETRRRLHKRFKNNFKIITHPSQQKSEKNIFVFTQERVVDLEQLSNIDFFVIDEFYKLDPREDSERSNILNQAFYKLWKTGAQFYLLGPNIKSIPENFEGYFNCKFINTDYSTVVSEVTHIPCDESEKPKVLVELAKICDDPTLIYCQSPASTTRVASNFLAAQIGKHRPELDSAFDWISNEFHEEWIVAAALKKGIGIHHGRIPRALAQFMVRAFNEGLLDFLICTSTLIEGVNTSAKNVIVYDHLRANRSLDYFTFNNIVGRSGRMFKHFIGRVYVFRDPPQEEFPFVDVPIINQDDETSESLLIQLEKEDLTEKSKSRLKEVSGAGILSIEFLKSNNGVDPKSQIGLAKDIIGNADYKFLLNWQAYPTYDELRLVCELIWKHLIPNDRRRAGVSSGSQLCYKIWRFTKNSTIKEIIKFELEEAEDPNEAVENALHFIRYWVTYHFPRLLMTVSKIQSYLFGENSGDYSLFASSIENFFLPPGAGDLEEYGVPIQASQKILPEIQPADDLDEVLTKLRGMEINEVNIQLHPFEANLFVDAMDYIK